MDNYNNTAVMVVTVKEMMMSSQHGQLQQHSSDGSDYHGDDSLQHGQLQQHSSDGSDYHGDDN